MGLRRNDKASRPWRLSAKLLIVSSVATVIGFSAICASVMIDMRHGEEALAHQTLENLASGIDADISRNVELFDLSLRAVASNMVMPEIGQVSTAIRQLILFDHAATAKHFGAIQVFDATGKLIIDAGGDTRDVQAILGHTSEVSSAHYSRDADQRLRGQDLIDVLVLLPAEVLLVQA